MGKVAEAVDTRLIVSQMGFTFPSRKT